MDTGLALLAHSGLQTKYWVDAFLTAIYLINRLPTPTLSNQTPYFKLFNHAPDYNFLRTFGCACFPLMRPYNPHKLTFRSKKCIFLGYSSNHHGYRCLDPSTNRVYISRDVVFNEQDFPTKNVPSLPPHVENSHLDESLPLPMPPHLGISLFPLNPHSSSSPMDTSTYSPLLSSSSPSPHQQLSPPQSPSPNSLLSTSDNPSQPNPPETSQPPFPSTRMVTRSMTGASRPKNFPNCKLYYSTCHPLKAFHANSLPTEPTTFNQAFKLPEW